MNNFSTPIPKANFSVQNLSHEYLTTMEMGNLVPIQCTEILPNDRFVMSTESFIRFAPLSYPVLSRINLKLFHFFVPCRLLWKYWEKFIAEDKLNNLGTSRRVKPYVHINRLAHLKLYRPGSLADYMGLPMNQFFPSGSVVDDSPVNDGVPLGQVSERIDLLPFLAYQKIYNDWFRNENIDDDIFNTDTDDPEVNQEKNLQNVVESEGVLDSDSLIYELFTLRKKAWEKDYFTSALPTPQYGEPAKVNIGLDGSDIQNKFGDTSGTIVRDKQTGRVLGPMNALSIQVNSDGHTFVLEDDPSGAIRQTEVVLDTNYEFEGNIAGSFTINDFRLAASIQRYNEAIMRAGHRYIEYIKAMYNMITPDYRLQRPELLGASSERVVINDVAQTSETTEDSAQGQLAGNAYAYDKTQKVRYTAQEHGFFITIACVIPRTVYANGLPRMFSRFNRLDYHNRYFEELGDQEIKNKEIFLDQTSNDDTFGYQIRYSDYKFKPSTIHGDFVNTLDFFTLSRLFNERPNLNSGFIRPDEGTLNRAFNITRGVDHLYSQFYHNLIIRRPMQDNPIPRII